MTARDHNAGTSLLEVMIALLIMAMSAAAIASVLFTLGQAGRQISVADHNIEQQLALEKLQNLAAALPANLKVPDQAVLQGSAKKLVFYSLDLAQSKSENLQVKIELSQNESQLEARISATGQPDKVLVLAEGVHSLDVTYWGRHDPALQPYWSSKWIGAPQLPSLVKINWQTRQGPAVPILLQPANHDRWHLRHLTQLVPKY